MSSSVPSGGLSAAARLGVRQPPVPAGLVTSTRRVIVAYRTMAFVTGVVLVAGCVTLILKYGTSVNVEPWTGYLWIAHGYLFLVYVIVTAVLGLRLRWPLTRYALVMLAGTIPTMSFVAEHIVTRAIRAATRTSGQPVDVRD